MKKIKFITLTVILVIILIESILKSISFSLMLPSDIRNAKEISEGKFKIVTLGESTTADFFSQEGDKLSWPRILARKLRKNGHSVSVVNLAQPSINSTFVLKNLKNYVANNDVDLIITMLGINDSGATSYIDSKSKSLNFLQKSHLFKILRWTVSVYKHSQFKKIKYDKHHFRGEGLSPELSSQLFQKLLKNDYKQFLKDSSRLSGCEKSTVLSEYVITTWSQPKYEKTEGKKKFMITMGQEAYKFCPGFSFSQNALLVSGMYKRNKKTDELVHNMLKEYGYNLSDIVLNHIFMYVGERSLPSELKEIARDRNIKLDGKSGQKLFYNQQTNKNYKSLYIYSVENKIPIVFVQYPTLEIKLIQNILNKIGAVNLNTVYLVENKKNFEEAIDRHGYDKIFVDRFGRTFGHATDLGDELIVEELYPMIEAIIQKQSITSVNNK